MSKWIIVISYALILFHNNYYYISLFHNIKHKPSSPHLFYCILSFHCYKGVHYCFSRPPTWKWSVFPAPSVLAGSWPVWCLPWPPPQCLLLVFKQCSTPILVKVYDRDLVRKVAGRCSAWCLPWPPPPVPAAVLQALSSFGGTHYTVSVTNGEHWKRDSCFKPETVRSNYDVNVSC